MTASPVPDYELPTHDVMVGSLLEAGKRYWPKGQGAVEAWLASHKLKKASSTQFTFIIVPGPAAHWGVGAESRILVPHCCIEGDQVDWARAGFMMLHCYAEQCHEAEHGPCQSYSTRMNIPQTCFDRAWVNRICLIARTLTAAEANVSEEELFGELPAAEIILTHDVDALFRPPVLRLKQAVFDLVNVFRLIRRGKSSQIPAHCRHALRKFFKPAKTWSLENVVQLNKKYGRKAVYHFYAGGGVAKSGPVHWLFDPSYSLDATNLAGAITGLAKEGNSAGLHPGFEAWQNAQTIGAEHQALQEKSGSSIGLVRQHWLRFSWRDTWRAQHQTGLRLDSTLGFNDRTGFRAAAALAFHPYNLERQTAEPILALPLVLMDSHLYDYGLMSSEEVELALDNIISEINAVHGTATINWHPHTINSDYGWQQGYEALLKLIGPGELPDFIKDPV